MKKSRLYYKVPEKYDQKYIYTSGITLIGNELFTLNEIIKHSIPIDIVIPIMISPDNVYLSFGCRFEIKKD